MLAIDYYKDQKRTNNFSNGFEENNNKYSLQYRSLNKQLLSNYSFNIHSNHKLKHHISNLIIDITMQYIFKGASHMRYNFDLISSFYFGSKIISQLVPLKHGNEIFGNLYGQTNIKYPGDIFADDQAYELMTICKQFDNKYNQTIIFQTGR